MYKAKEKILWFAVLSRVIVLLLQMIFNFICPDHDADAFRLPVDSTDKPSFLDNIVTFILGGLTRWDAQYYIHIARYGYTYENTLAFFPLFPLAMRHAAIFLHIEPPILIFNNTLVVFGFVINFLCFIKASLIMFDLSEVVFKNPRVAYRAAILFCINPASIFFSAIYSESMFAYLTFYSMLESVRNNPCVFIPISLSTLVRSNGLVNVGFPIFIWFRNLLVVSIPNYVSENKHYHSNKRSLVFNSRHLLISFAQIICLVILALLPFFLLQVYSYTRFCKIEYNVTALPYHVQQYARENNLVLPGQVELEWCNKQIPMAYSHIQNKYWNVGFMRYYEFKQIPNFVLAFPVLYLMFRCCMEYFSEHKSRILTLEFYTGKKSQEKSCVGKYPLDMFVFVVHGSFLTFLCIFYVHIQVSTRLLCSASPLLYWYCALITMSDDKSSEDVKKIEYESQENSCSWWRVFFLTQKRYSPLEKLIYGYFIGFFIGGCFMFSNFLPWT